MNNNEHESATRLDRSTGVCAGSVAAYASLIASESPPLLAWAEPAAGYARDGKPGSFAEFQKFTRGLPDWPADVPLAEARMFWADRAVHVVAGANGCRWAEIAERADGKDAVQKTSYPVLTLRDRARFGIDAEAENVPEALQAVEYRMDGRLLGWRLVPQLKQAEE